MTHLRVWLACGLLACTGAESDEHVSLLQTMAIKRQQTMVIKKATCDDLCREGEERYPEGLNGKCTKLLAKADKKPKKCAKFKKTKRVGVTAENPKGRIKHTRVVGKCCKPLPCDNPCPEDAPFDEAGWKGKCTKLMKRALVRSRVCQKIHGRGKFAGRKLQTKFADKCCIPATTTTDADTAVATTTTPAAEETEGGTTLSPEEEAAKEKEKRDKEKCGQDYKFIEGYTSTGFKQEANSGGLKCAKLCDRTPRCNAYEFLKNTKACYLQDKTEPTVSTSQADRFFCQKPADRRTGPCEEDYDQVLGYVNGAGTVRDVKDVASMGSGNSILDTVVCADHCNKDPACNSYEYWPGTHTSHIARCELNWNEDLTHGQGVERSDFAFCIKGSSDRAKACKKGYELNEGQVSGAGQIATKTDIDDPVDCAELCDNDPACNSYEYSFRYQRCELNYRLEPNLGTHWYDMHMCAKPERRRAAACPSGKANGYDYKMGQLSGQQFLTKTSVTSLADCAAECEKDPRCNSFEYSQTHDRCELNNPDIPNAESEWYDMKFCQKPVQRRAKECDEQYDYIYGRVPGAGSKQRLQLPTTNHSTALCAAKCDALEECRSYEYDVLLRYCDLNWQPAPTHNDTENDFKFCSKKANNRATSCKGKYTKVDGQIPGHGQVLYKDGLTADECAVMCDGDGGCNSYEYSHMYNRCELNYRAEPSSQTFWYDMVFCAKAEEEQEPACDSQYEYKTGQLSGHQYLTLTLHTMEECADKCTEDPRCNSYEYSWKYNRCELNNKDETNSATEWYDMKFCFKPEALRDGPCGEEYDQTEGYTPGVQIRTTANVVDTHACAKICDNEEACRSYEYTVMGRSCEMHWNPNATTPGVHAGYVFCQKAEEDRAKSCKLGFKLMAGQRTGTHVQQGHMELLTNIAAIDCAQKCDDDEACFAYEYSHTYNKCELLWRPIPNSASTTYDYRFCQKPEEKWQETCASDYEYKIGSAAAQRYLAPSALSFEECAKQCDNDPRCNMYGYGRKYKYCFFSTTDVPFVNEDYYDMRFCRKPDARRPKDCASNYDYIFGRVPGGGSHKRVTRTATMMNTDDCAKLCDAEDACRSYEYETASGYCDMNWQPAPTSNTTEGAFKFCSKKENDRAPSCTGDYIRKPGVQQIGGGSIATQTIQTAEECAKLCDDDGGCNSYEYTHKLKRCDRNYAAEASSQTTYLDQVFCQKPEDRRPPQCDGQYEPKTGQLSGQQFLTVTLQSMQACADKCTEDARCNSYEYSWKYRRCELNNPDVTNTETLWYDMKFCWKPLDMRSPDCGEEYDEVIGSVSGGGSIRGVASKDALDCAELCDNDGACMSYEYSVMAQRCELNWNKEPTAPTIAAGYHFCQKASGDRAKSCVNGYELIYGQYNNAGGAQIGATKTLENPDDCAKECDNDKACFSYEFSQTYNKCELNSIPEPNLDTHWYDMRFCQKPKNKRADLCEKDYSFLLGQMSGSQFVTQTLTQASQCSKLCDDDDRCNAYEYSQRYNRCELNYMDTTNSLSPWYDMKFCAKPQSKQQRPCAKDYDYVYGRVPGAGSALNGRTTSVLHTDDCAKKCDDEESCRAYEYDPRIRYCDLNYQAKPTHNDTENNFKFCSKKKNNVATSCRNDYVKMEGQIPGHGQIRYQDNVDADQCSKMCDQEVNCFSYEYSHRYNRCELNYRPIPSTHTLWYDMIFCQKPEKRQADACIQGYTYMPGQLSGQQFLTVTIQSMKECGTQCEKDARCNSYEYSHKYKRCELNNNPSTNAVSEWYDMKFCQKAEEDREPSCGEAYTETEGYMPSSQVRAVGAVKDTRACAKLCEDETACKSYEYSILAQRCELNWDLKPTVGVQAGYHLCVKAADDLDKACQNDYELMEGQMAGSQFKTLTLEKPGDCAKECDKEDNCNSYEFSFNYNRCELNYRPEPNNPTRWYDMRFCSKPKAKRTEFCPGGYKYFLGQMSGSQFSTLSAITSVQQCQTACDKDGRCNSFEYSRVYKRCELNWYDIPNHPAEWYDNKFCQKPDNKREDQCGPGYDNLYGRVPGSGFRRMYVHQGIQSTKDCAKECDKEEACRSYEYQVMTKYCDMNYQALPTQNFTEAGFDFCSKTEKNRASSCKMGFELLDGQLAGYQYQTITTDADTCAKMCVSNKMCNSYEYSHVYNRCELNWQPRPNSMTRYYDMKFCMKPAGKREEFCDGDYKHFEGQLNGQQFLTLTTISSMKDCAKECNKDPRCNSYEYSSKYTRCELNYADVPNHIGYWYDLKFCQKPEELRPENCSEDYEFDVGQFNGGGNIKTVGAVFSTDDCAKLCDDETACKSYEHSVNARSCQLNWAADKNNNNSATGYHFCKKASSDVAKTCQGDYVMMPGQVNGAGQISTTTLDTVEKCKALCDDNKNCNSYEYSMHYNRCELNYRPIPNHEGHWYDMKFCAKPDSKQEEPCTKGYTYLVGQLSGHQIATITGSTTIAMHSKEECAAKCDEDSRCNSYEFSVKYNRCELNYWTETNSPTEWYDMKFCQRPWKDRPEPCAKEYTHLRGQISGTGQIMTHSNNVEIQSTEECAEACDDDHGCNSYEYSVHHKQCHMNYDAEPNKNETYMDFTFCQKGVDERYEVCQEGYEQRPGQLSGRQYLTLTTVLKPEHCAQRCDDDEYCNSYEFSHKYNRCELNWRPEPSLPTYWYDMKFCSKPEDSRKNICENSYEFALGQVSGSQFLTRTGITLKACAGLCDADLRCNSYEYSVKYVRCELNYHEEPTHDTEWYDMKMCVKPKDKQAPACAGDYEFKPGQIPPSQIQITGAILGTKECAAMCDEKPGCKSYEYSFLAKQCQLNWDAEPSLETPQAGLFKFCTKHADDQATTCGGGYRLFQGQNSQAPSLAKTTFEDGPSGCQQLCDDDETCFAYEFSYKYKKCDLNWRTEPSTETRWYDLQFCQKPPSKWPTVCADGYKFMEGQTTSQYEVKTNIFGTQACADYCSREQRCLSYEYSPKYQRCELNTVAEPTTPNTNWYDLKFCSKEEQ